MCDNNIRTPDYRCSYKSEEDAMWGMETKQKRFALGATFIVAVNTLTTFCFSLLPSNKIPMDKMLMAMVLSSGVALFCMSIFIGGSSSLRGYGKVKRVCIRDESVTDDSASGYIVISAVDPEGSPLWHEKIWMQPEKATEFKEGDFCTFLSPRDASEPYLAVRKVHMENIPIKAKQKLKMF